MPASEFPLPQVHQQFHLVSLLSFVSRSICLAELREVTPPAALVFLLNRNRNRAVCVWMRIEKPRSELLGLHR